MMMSRRTGLALASFLTTLFLIMPAWAQSLSLNLGGGATDGPGGASATGRIVQLLALLTVLSIAPGILMICTSFTRIVIVLSLLRSALGTQSTPPNTVMLSLALFLTAFIMAPTFQKAYTDGIQPLMSQKIDEITAFQRTVDPFRQFMLKHVREKDMQLFTDLSHQGPFATPQDVPLQIVVPAFVISEMRRGFEIGFLVFIPFIIIDMVVASILMAMGMVTLPPVTISLPFKIIFFVLIDGWYLIAGSLIQSYGT
jgi:flagellar biosynthetic protein FliP